MAVGHIPTVRYQSQPGRARWAAGRDQRPRAQVLRQFFRRHVHTSGCVFRSASASWMIAAQSSVGSDRRDWPGPSLPPRRSRRVQLVLPGRMRRSSGWGWFAMLCPWMSLIRPQPKSAHPKGKLRHVAWTAYWAASMASEPMFCQSATRIRFRHSFFETRARSPSSSTFTRGLASAVSCRSST